MLDREAAVEPDIKDVQNEGEAAEDSRNLDRGDIRVSKGSRI